MFAPKRIPLFVFALAMAVMLKAQSEATYRANIGKTAFNATNGVELGKIVDVASVNGVWVYRVNREGRIINSPVKNVVAKDVLSTTSVDTSPEANAQIDPSMQATAKEFSGRLGQYNGRLQALTLKGIVLVDRWSSAKCDYYDGEAIDLLLSVNRTVKPSVDIDGQRVCGGKTKTFKLSSSRFRDYREGKLSDSEVLKTLR